MITSYLHTTGTMSSVSQALSTSFHQTAASLYSQKKDNLVLTDSKYHHCWTFPSSLSSTPPSLTSSKGGTPNYNKTCCCGRINLSMIGSCVEWSTVSSWRGLFPLIPEESLQQTGLNTDRNSTHSSPFLLSDSFPHTVAALTLSKHLSSLVLRTHSSIL